MSCRNCSRRAVCVQPCPKLEAKLREVEKSGNEIIVEPGLIPRLAHEALFCLADLQPERPWSWESLAATFPGLDALQVEIFLSRYCDGLEVRRIAEDLGIHRVTVCRRLREAFGVIREGRRARVERREEPWRPDRDAKRS